MRHPRDRDWSRFIDDDLPPLRQMALAEHLAHCPACRKVVAAYRQMGRMGHSIEGPAWSGQAARDAWRRSINKAESGGASRRLQWAAGLVGVVLLVSLAGAMRWEYRAGLARQTERLVSEHNTSRMGDLSLALGENRP